VVPCRRPDDRLFWAVGSISLSNVDSRIKVTSLLRHHRDGHARPLSLETGSGNIKLTKASGDVVCDTGSGDVELSAVNCGDLKADTGSGNIVGSDITAEDFHLDTGSGDIRISSVHTSRASLDTGSGSVDLGLATDIESLAVDTGSGNITVRVPSSLGADVSLEFEAARSTPICRSSSLTTAPTTCAGASATATASCRSRRARARSG
jgi:DUF4097 and DUF4098 domain-containing protein YvlB